MNASIAPCRKGRPTFTELEAATRSATKAHYDLLAIEQQFNDLLCLTNDDDRSKEVRQIAQDRLDVAQNLAAVLDLKKQASADLRAARGAGNTDQLNAKIELLKKQEAELFNHLWSLPQLGATQKEWDTDYDESLKTRPLGRPSLPIEVLLIRARDKVKECESHLRNVERCANVDTPCDPKALAKQMLSVSTGKRRPGKPKLDALGKLDKMINKINAAIFDLQSKENASDRVTLSSKGNPLGRRPQSTDAKLQALQSERDTLILIIQQEEAKLSRPAQIRREIKKIRDAAMKIKAKALKETSHKAFSELSAQYESLRKLASDLEADAIALERDENDQNGLDTTGINPINVDVSKVTSECLKELDQHEQLMLRAAASLERQSAIQERIINAKRRISTLNTEILV